MKYSQLDHKRMWVRKLKKDLKGLESLGYCKNSSVYKDGINRIKKVQMEVKSLEGLMPSGNTMTPSTYEGK